LTSVTRRSLVQNSGKLSKSKQEVNTRSLSLVNIAIVQFLNNPATTPPSIFLSLSGLTRKNLFSKNFSESEFHNAFPEKKSRKAN